MWSQCDLIEMSFGLFVLTGRRTVEENNTAKYKKPILFTPQTSSPDSTSSPVNPHSSMETRPQQLLSIQSAASPSKNHQNTSRKRKLESRRQDDQLSGFCRKSLCPNKYGNFIITEMGGDTNPFQILQTSAAKQKALIHVTYSMIGNETYVQYLRSP